MLKLLALLLPPLIDLINRKVADKDNRFWISVLVCAFFGIFLNFAETNMFQGIATVMALLDGIGESILIVFGLAQLSYKALWENSAARKDAGLNAKTQNLDP